MVTVAWSLGVRGKLELGSANAKTVYQIITQGPIYLLVWLLLFFIPMYLWQRRTGVGAGESSRSVYFCPSCHTPQYQHERRCNCAAELEPMDNWKWV